MSDLKKMQHYVARYLQHLERIGNDDLNRCQRAFEAVEAEHVAEVGHGRFSTWESFRVVLCRKRAKDRRR